MSEEVENFHQLEEVLEDLFVQPDSDAGETGRLQAEILKPLGKSPEVETVGDAFWFLSQTMELALMDQDLEKPFDQAVADYLNVDVGKIDWVQTDE